MIFDAFCLLLDCPASLWRRGTKGDAALAERAPGFESRKDEPELAKDYWISNIHNPSITVYLPPKDKATGAAVVICPGGGHRELVFKAEGDEPARYLNSLGVAAFALKYRLGREPNSPYSIQKHALRGRPCAPCGWCAAGPANGASTRTVSASWASRRAARSPRWWPIAPAKAIPKPPTRSTG